MPQILIIKTEATPCIFNMWETKTDFPKWKDSELAKSLNRKTEMQVDFKVSILSVWSQGLEWFTIVSDFFNSKTVMPYLFIYLFVSKGK